MNLFTRNNHASCRPHARTQVQHGVPRVTRYRTSIRESAWGWFVATLDGLASFGGYVMVPPSLAELSCCSDRSVLPSLLLPERSYARRSPAATLSRVFLLYVFSRRSRNKHSTSLLRPVFAKPAPLHIRCGRKDAALGEPEAEDVEERDAESHRPVDPSRFPKRGPSRPPGTSWCHND